MNSVSVWMFICALLFSLLAAPVASVTAGYLNLIDHPSIRKRHAGKVPLAGGIVLIAGLWAGLYFLPKSDAVWAVSILGVPLFTLGALDDKYDLSATLRIFAQLFVGMGLLFFGISIQQLDELFGSSSITLIPAVSVMFTLLCACGVLNAINMADGIDGLLGSVSIVSLAGIAWLSLGANAIAETSLALVVMGLLAGYLAYNLGLLGAGRRIFLGDSGSMVIGLVMLVLLIELSQRDAPVITPTSAGWLLGLPLLDTISVMVRRVCSRRSPFSAGRDHFHHVLQDLGLSRGITLKLMICAQSVFVSVGVYANQASAPQFIFFWLFVIATFAQYFGISWAVKHIGNGQLTEQGIQESQLKEANG